MKKNNEQSTKTTNVVVVGTDGSLHIQKVKYVKNKSIKEQIEQQVNAGLNKNVWFH